MGACISRTNTVTMEETNRTETIRADTVINVTKDMGDVALETVFPKSAICRISDADMGMTKDAMAKLEDGREFRCEGLGSVLISGSRPEGLALENDWGHEAADFDHMHLYGGPLGVNVVGGQQPRGRSCLDFHHEGCPPAYTKLQVTDYPELKKHLELKRRWNELVIGGRIDGSEGKKDRSVHKSGDQLWLNTYQVVREMLPFLSVTGPAAMSYYGGTDVVTSLACNGPHPGMCQEYCSRSRQWPPTSLVTFLLQLPMLLVLVGHKLSPERGLQARISWSHLELHLMLELPESVRQGYIACKYVLKHFLKVHRGHNDAGDDRSQSVLECCVSCTRRQNEAVDGRSSVGSYHIKTVFLRFLEKTPPLMITSPFGLFLDLLNELDVYLNMGELPHYFLAQCDLLETVDAEERCLTRQVIREILSDPLNALLTSPTDPQQIYGEVHPDLLAVTFRAVSAQPTCQEQRKILSKLLARVDEWRRERYGNQRERDTAFKSEMVSGRAELTDLVGMLKQIKLS